MMCGLGGYKCQNGLKYGLYPEFSWFFRKKMPARVGELDDWPETDFDNIAHFGQFCQIQLDLGSKGVFK